MREGDELGTRDAFTPASESGVVDGADRDAPDLNREKMRRVLRNKARLEAVERTGLLDSAFAIPSIDRAVRIAARALRAPVASVNVLTDSLLAPIAVYLAPEETTGLWRSRRRVGHSYCKYVVGTREAFVVDNAPDDDRVRHSHATRELDIAAYLGVPIRATDDGSDENAVVGTLSVVDHVPRVWTSLDLETLTDIAAGIEAEIAYRGRMQREVRAAEAHTSRLLDAAGAAVLGTDANGVTTFSNKAAQRILGYTAEELIGKDQHALVHHSHPDGSRYLEADCPNYAARRAGRVFTNHNDTFWRSDGTPVAVQTTMTPIFDRGEVIGTVLTFVDVGEHVAVEDAERSARRSAEAASNAKSELLAAISQELRIPLAEIGDHVRRLEESARERADSGNDRSLLEGIRRGHQRLVGLLDNMRGFANLE